jgi:hypothetical protein
MAYLESRNTITTKAYRSASTAPRGSYRVVYLTQPGSRARSVKPTAPRQILPLRSHWSVYHLARLWLLFVSFHQALAEVKVSRTVYRRPAQMTKEHKLELLLLEIVSRVFSLERWRCKVSYISKNRATSGKCCKAAGRELISPRGCKFSYTHVEGYISHEDNLTEAQRLAHDGERRSSP